MTSEQIEKAADSYAVAARPSFVNGYFDRDAVADAFEAGARFRISSVWHEASEMYEIRLSSVIEFKNGKIAVYSDLRDVTYDGLWDEVKRYAYLKDLLPERKEGTE